jgi:3-keto-5-aminohexanoate cleavage enzyme
MDVIVNFAPTGMIPTKKMTPHVPISINEIVEDVHKASEIGISMVHLHARDEMTGEPTYKAENYRKIIEKIRRFSKELVVCVSLSGRNFQEFSHRSEPLQLDGESKPDMGSLTLSSLNFNHIESINSPEMIQSLAAEMKRKGIPPELEAFDTGMINYAKYLERKGLIEQPHYFNLIFGNISCAQADMLHAGLMVKDLPANSYWSFGGVGRAQLPMNSLSLIHGWGVRVGLEDNIWFDRDRTRLASNADLLQRIHVIAASQDRTIMQPRRLRELLNLQAGNGSYGRDYRKLDNPVKV